MTRLRGADLSVPPVRPASVDPDAVVTVLRVPPELAGSRVDRFVHTELKRASRTRAAAIVRASAFSADARPLSPGARVRAEDLVCLWRAPWDEAPGPESLPILYEDDSLLAIDKPAMVPVHPSARYHQSTVVKILERQIPGFRPRLSHRLDRETSGVLLLTKHALADRLVKKQFEARHAVRKVYLAIVYGNWSQRQEHVHFALELDPTHPTGLKMRVAPSGGLKSHTEVEGLSCRFDEQGSPYSLVRCTLHTGRQHQIRAHMSAMGSPVLGDKLYGADSSLFAKGIDGELTDAEWIQLVLPRHALHASELELSHPDTGERVTFSAPLPEDMAAFWESLLAQ